MGAPGGPTPGAPVWYVMRRMATTPEHERLAELRHGRRVWRRWGPYLSERQWGTVREDYSATGEAWEYFPHDHARSRAYRWGEDGLLGVCDEQGFLCLALALWNEADPILKERLFGLTGNEGNHGEDVKEYYFFLDSTPTHSYMRALYKYPQRAFPYAELVAGGRRSREEAEYELIDTGVFDDDRYFDVVVEYAKAAPEDILMRIAATNRGPDPAPLRILPTLWFRNTWAWGEDDRRPELFWIENRRSRGAEEVRLVKARHHELGEMVLAARGVPELLFTENESNRERLWRAPNTSRYVKDGIHRAIVCREVDAVNPAHHGTKVAVHYRYDEIAPGDTVVVQVRLARGRYAADFSDFEDELALRRQECDQFYAQVCENASDPDAALVQRQAFAGLLWSKQLYRYDVGKWLDGDPAGPPPPPERKRGRNAGWRHLDTAEVLSMPDTWEYPWFAAWDLAFHCIPLALIDPDFAKEQLTLLLTEWYMHPNGQLPAYEWAFDDVNPPVHAWAAWRVYKIAGRVTGRRDRAFLERVFHKLLLNFTWWVNRKDSEGRNVFQGGFLGLDNVGVFDRSKPLPGGGVLEQSDGTAWMGMYCLNMLAIALELAREDHVYEDVAVKFFEHFLYIAGALNNLGGDGLSLWDNQDEFFYDVVSFPTGQLLPIKVRSMVGLIPLLAVETIEPGTIEAMPKFARRLEWFLDNRPGLAALVSHWQQPGAGQRRLLALVRGHRLKRLLFRMLDPNEFLSDHGVRSVSKFHQANPFTCQVDGATYGVDYEPAESRSGLFGGNSNWRGPIWFPLNYLLIESLQKFHHYYGDDFLVEHPTGSGQMRTLEQIGDELSRRLTSLFVRDAEGRRPVFGDVETFQRDPHWRDLIPFYEYFHGDTGRGLGASHQTGWTALVAKLIDQAGRHEAGLVIEEPAPVSS